MDKDKDLRATLPPPCCCRSSGCTSLEKGFVVMYNDGAELVSEGPLGDLGIIFYIWGATTAWLYM